MVNFSLMVVDTNSLSTLPYAALGLILNYQAGYFALKDSQACEAYFNFLAREQLTLNSVLVLARDLDNVIGVNGDLYWHLPADMARFRARTSKKIIGMGSATFRTMPLVEGGFKALPGRLNLIFTRQALAYYQEERNSSTPLNSARELPFAIAHSSQALTLVLSGYWATVGLINALQCLEKRKDSQACKELARDYLSLLIPQLAQIFSAELIAQALQELETLKELLVAKGIDYQSFYHIGGARSFTDFLASQATISKADFPSHQVMEELCLTRVFTTYQSYQEQVASSLVSSEQEVTYAYFPDLEGYQLLEGKDLEQAQSFLPCPELSLSKETLLSIEEDSKALLGVKAKAKTNQQSYFLGNQQLGILCSDEIYRYQL